ncbi:MAG: family 43 glycosylhydrolase [Bacteroidaceae bacterium]|nr:family 43 glycosylhydrolase [Bacteroidaceae bacterium]
MSTCRQILVALLLALTICPASASVITLADPTIFYDNGVFYLSGTSAVNEGFSMYSSTDLVHWTARAGKGANGLALSKNDVFGSKNFWAPQIFKRGDTYYMAYAAEEQIAIAYADNPAGPFKQDVQQKLPSSTGQIDPFVFIDDDGKAYLYYVRFTGGNQLWVAELTDDMQSIKSSTLTFCLGAAGGTWENTTGGTPISEGPTVIKDGEYYYLLYSANDYQNINYAVGYAYSKSPLGPWTKHPEPILSRHHLGQNGTGHGDLFRDEEGGWWYVFHLHSSNNAVHSRRTAIVPLTLTGNPEDEFHIDYERYYVLDDAATPSAKVPEAPVFFQSEGLTYKLLKTGRCAVTYPEGTHFGDYKGHVVIPDSVWFDNELRAVSEIGHDAFYRCTELTAVTLPSTVTALRYAAFEGCSSLRNIVAQRGQAPSVAALVFDASTSSEGKLWVPEGAWRNYSNASGWKSFTRISGNPDEANEFDFSANGFYFSIVDSAVATCKVVSRNSDYNSYPQALLEVPQTVDNGTTTWNVIAIGESAFRNCGLVNDVVLPESVVSLENNAFKGASGLQSISIPASLSRFGTSCFDGCTALTSVDIKDISAWCNASFINYTSTPLYLAHNFSIGGVPVTELELPEGLSSLCKYAFSGASCLKSVVFPKGLTFIGAYSFYNCTGLTEVTIPAEVSSIGAGAFLGCSNLTTVSVEATEPPSIGSTTFARETKAGTLRVPVGTRDAYLEAPTWKSFSNIEEYTPSSINPALPDDASSPFPASSPIYDLLGRRVLCPIPGNIYIQNHKKIVLPYSDINTR